jgi:hypothetical protein
MIKQSKIMVETIKQTIFCDVCGKEIYNYVGQCEICEKDLCEKCIGDKDYCGDTTVFNCKKCWSIVEKYKKQKDLLYKQLDDLDTACIKECKLMAGIEKQYET